MVDKNENENLHEKSIPEYLEIVISLVVKQNFEEVNFQSCIFI